jgi:precorrin-6A/cobalt-precorrin-6A reductase
VILLMGGTSESAMIAKAMADAGFSVLVSMATEIPLAIPSERNIESRHGRLDLEQLADLIKKRGITALVDAAHPFASEAHQTAQLAAQNANIPYLHWMREESNLSGFSNLHMAGDHATAAQLAVALGCPILLTIGSRNISPYVSAARKAQLPVYARILPCQESEESCRSAGLHDSEVIAARGPFTVEDTLLLIQTLKIGTLVTKESGRAGGVPEKLEAAARAKCKVVVVKRTTFDEHHLCRTVGELIDRLTFGRR